MPTKGSDKAAGHDLYANQGTEIPAKEQAVIGTGIVIGLPHDTYGRIAPGSGLAVKHRLTTNAGVIDSDYTGEAKVAHVNQGNQPYRVKRETKSRSLLSRKSTTRNYKQ